MTQPPHLVSHRLLALLLLALVGAFTACGNDNNGVVVLHPRLVTNTTAGSSTTTTSGTPLPGPTTTVFVTPSPAGPSPTPSPSPSVLPSPLIKLGSGTVFPGTLQEEGDFVSPTSGLVTDLNGDAFPDAAFIVNTDLLSVGDGAVGVMLNNGNGTYGVPTFYDLPQTATGGSVDPQSITSGVFTASGHVDLVVADVFNPTVYFLAGNGDGTFHASVAIDVSKVAIGGVAGLAAGHLTGSANLDLVIVDGDNPCHVSILPGQGTGAFTVPASATATSSNSTAFASAVYVAPNNLGNSASTLPSVVVPEDVTATSGATEIFKQTATAGTLAAGVSLNDGSGASAPIGVAFANFDQDAGGLTDVVVSNLNNSVSVFLNGGNGFSATAPSAPEVITINHIQTPLRTAGVAAADMDGQHGPDILVGSTDLQQGTIILNNGSSTPFSGTPTINRFIAGEGTWCVAAVDVDNDGKLDAVCFNGGATDQSISVAHGNGDGTVTTPRQVTAATNDPYNIAVGDFGNGHQDVAVVTAEGVHVFLGDGSGNFNEMSGSPVALPNAPVHAFNIVAANLGSGHVDLAVLDYDNSRIDVLVNQNNATPFDSGHIVETTLPVTIPSIPPFPTLDVMVAGDVNNDTFNDLVLALPSNPTQSVIIFPGTATAGTFASPQAVSIPVGGFPPLTVNGNVDAVSLATLDGSNHLGLLVGTDEGELIVCPGNGTLSFPTTNRHRYVLASGASVNNIVAGDLNGDGKVDVAALAVTPPLPPGPSLHASVFSLTGNGDGTLNSPQAVGFTVSQDGRFASSPTSLVGQNELVMSDLNGDGLADLVLASSSKVMIAMSQAAPAGPQFNYFEAHADPFVAAVADFNGDSKPDLVVLNVTGGVNATVSTYDFSLLLQQ